MRGFEANKILMVIDGVRMNTAIFRGGNIQNVISLDPFATEKAEVLFGPSSVIYGSDAIGGVMSFQTLTPQFSKDDKTFISGNAFLEFIKGRAKELGQQIGVEYAEGFITKKLLGIRSLDAIIQNKT